MTETWKAEQDRQSQELSEILNNAINEYGKRVRAEGRQPMLNAVASALVTATGSMLASVEDRRLRKMLRQLMERGLPTAIAACEGRTGSAEIIVANRRLDA